MSSGALARVNLVLAFIGLSIASMLSLSHLLDIQLPCGVGSGCDLVTQDPRSTVLHIPIAYYGLLGYSLFAILALVRVFSPRTAPKFLQTLGYLFSLAGLLISIGLTVFSVKSIHALCTWCIGSAITMSLLFVTHSIAAIKEPNQTSPRFRDAVLAVLVAGISFGGVMFGISQLKEQATSTLIDRGALKDLSEEELLPEDAHVTGPENAKATVVMFGDLTCPVCQQAYQTITELMQHRHDFRLAFRQLPLSFHPYARRAALISEMAAEKGRFWDFATACYNSEWDGVDGLVAIGVRQGLTKREIMARLRDPNDPAAQVLARDAQVTQKLGLYSTPSVFILIDGYFPEPITYRGIEQMIDNNTATPRTKIRQRKPPERKGFIGA